MYGLTSWQTYLRLVVRDSPIGFRAYREISNVDDVNGARKYT